MKLFLAMQVRVMAACMESQADILECTTSAQSDRRKVTVCFLSDVYGVLREKSNGVEANIRKYLTFTCVLKLG